MGAHSHTRYGVARALLALLFLCLVVLVMRPFIYAIAWALVITVSSWPVHKIIKTKFSQGSDAMSASFSTIIITLFLLCLLVPLSVQVTQEANRFLQLSKGIIENDATFDTFISRIPGLTRAIEQFATEDISARKQILEFVNEHQEKMFSVISFAAQGVGHFLFGVGVTIFTTFYLFRYGELLAGQLMSVALYLGGKEYQSAIRIVWSTIGAVLYGVVVAALVQGLLAGIGFYIFGAPLPILFGCITILLGLIPFGPPLLYLPMSGYLLYNGSSWYSALGLVVWGVALVSTADNIFRPLFISRATSLPILLAFFGGLGGIAAFGMIGLFLGPVLLAVCQEIWKRVISKANAKNPVSPTLPSV